MTAATDPTPPSEISRVAGDVDPDRVARHVTSRAAWAERIGHPMRCKTNIVHPALGCCLFCGAESGENCKDISHD